MSDHTPKLIRIKLTTNTIQLVPYWPDNAETWFLYAEADFREQGVSDPQSRFLAVIRSLPRELNSVAETDMSADIGFLILITTYLDLSWIIQFIQL
ncbi:unnamed protein product [Heterobilharzia americana]|nr:unnamed protein product [Heterobilharzia americana]